jgi:hypothetical protein
MFVGRSLSSTNYPVRQSAITTVSKGEVLQQFRRLLLLRNYSQFTLLEVESRRVEGEYSQEFGSSGDKFATDVLPACVGII